MKITPKINFNSALIRRNAARKLVAGNYNNQKEYDTLAKVVDLPPLSGEGSDDDTTKKLLTQAKEEMKTGFDDAKSAKAAAFQEETVRFKELQEEERKATPLFEKTPVDSFLTGKTDDTDKAAADRIEQNRASVQREAMNPIRAAERMRTELGGGDTSMMSGAEREEAQRKQEDAARRAAAFEQQRRNTERQRAEDSAGVNRGDFGAQPTVTEGCVIATHGLSTGGFTKLEKAKAEIWCAKTYHGKWYGEAFRRGYKAWGMSHINAGTAPNVYQEFKDFVAYGRGVKKGFGLGLNYYLRTAQFFITGLFISE